MKRYTFIRTVESASGWQYWEVDAESREAAFAKLCDVHGNIIDSHRSRPMTATAASSYDPLTMQDVRARVFSLIDRTPNLTWLCLTKRPENIERMMPDTMEGYESGGPQGWIPEPYRPNVWLGMSASTQEDLDRGVPHLLKVPAAVRFLSLEPLLGPVDISRWTTKPAEWLKTCREEGSRYAKESISARRGISDANRLVCGDMQDNWIESYEREKNRMVSWVIVGGESGPNARPMHPDWVRSIRDQCVAAGVPFFMKQMGGKRKPFDPIPDDLMIREFPNA